MLSETEETWHSSLETTPAKEKRSSKKRASDVDDDASSSGGLEVGSPFDPAKGEYEAVAHKSNSVKRNNKRRNNNTSTAVVAAPISKIATVTASENVASNKKTAKAAAVKSSIVPNTSTSSTTTTSTSAANVSIAAAAASSTSAKKSKTGYKKKLIRLFSNASDVQSTPEQSAKAQLEQEKAALQAQLAAAKSAHERELFQLQVQLTELKNEMADVVEERDIWKARCLNQKQKIEQMEADAVKLSKMMAQHQYVPGHAFHNVREPSFCPDY